MPKPLRWRVNLLAQETFTNAKLRHIVNNLSGSVRQTTSLRPPCWGWSSLSVCPCCTLPLISLVLSHLTSFSEVCVVLEGLHLPLKCDAEQHVSPSEGQFFKASALYLNRRAMLLIQEQCQAWLWTLGHAATTGSSQSGADLRVPDVASGIGFGFSPALINLIVCFKFFHLHWLVMVL